MLTISDTFKTNQINRYSANKLYKKDELRSAETPAVAYWKF